MALEMSYSDKFGNDYPLSYWRLVQINFSPSDETASFTFYGYKDEAARLSGKAASGSKTYSIAKEAYATYLSVAAITGLDKNVLNNGYTLAKATLEVGGKSFFDGAIDA